MLADTSNRLSLRSFITGQMVRLFYFTGIWIILGEGEFVGPAFAVPTILAACWFSMILAGSEYVLWPHKVLFYLPLFLLKSFQGGVDVMRRALNPRMPLAPTLFEYPLTLPPGTPRVFFANIITLLPGTVSVDFRGDQLLIHVLNRHGLQTPELRALEKIVAELYRLKLSKGPEG